MSADQIRQAREKLRTIEHRLNDPEWNTGAQFILWSMARTAGELLDQALAEAETR